MSKYLSQTGSNIWLIKFKDNEPPLYSWSGPEGEDGDHYIKHKLKIIFDQINDTAKVISGMIPTDNIFVLQNQDDVDDAIYSMYIKCIFNVYAVHSR